MKNIVLIALLACTSCARFHSVQIKTEKDGSKTENRQTITTFWDSQSAITKLKVSTTDKTETLSIGSLAEESSSTNVNSLVEGVTSAVISAAIKATIKP